eukprot:sb/3465269/
MPGLSFAFHPLGVSLFCISPTWCPSLLLPTTTPFTVIVELFESTVYQEPTETSDQPIRTRYLGHVTGHQPIRDQYFLIRSVPVCCPTYSLLRVCSPTSNRDNNWCLVGNVTIDRDRLCQKLTEISWLERLALLNYSRSRLCDTVYQISDRSVYCGPGNRRRKMPFLAKNYKNILLLSGTRGWGRWWSPLRLPAQSIETFPAQTNCDDVIRQCDDVIRHCDDVIRQCDDVIRREKKYINRDPLICDRYDRPSFASGSNSYSEIENREKLIDLVLLTLCEDSEDQQEGSRSMVINHNLLFVTYLTQLFCGFLPLSLPSLHEPTETSKQPIRTRYLSHVTGYQPIRDQHLPSLRALPDLRELSPRALRRLRIPKSAVGGCKVAMVTNGRLVNVHEAFDKSCSKHELNK